MINVQLLRDKSVAKKITDIRSEKEHTTSNRATPHLLFFSLGKRTNREKQNNKDIGASSSFKRFVGRAWSPRASV